MSKKKVLNCDPSRQIKIEIVRSTLVRKHRKKGHNAFKRVQGMELGIED